MAKSDFSLKNSAEFILVGFATLPNKLAAEPRLCVDDNHLPLLVSGPPGESVATPMNVLSWEHMQYVTETTGAQARQERYVFACD